MVEHHPWVGRDYESGIGGQRIAIIGYSHHRDRNDRDRENFTVAVVSNVINGEQRGDSFFATVRGYFGCNDREKFWNRVMFFNFLPNCIGVADQRYGAGTREQIDCAKKRLLRIIGEHKPDKMLVFTMKGWREFPPTSQEQAGNQRIPLGLEFPPKFSWGTYAAGDHSAMAFGLRHPQGARGKVMRLAVQRILDTARIRSGRGEYA